MAFAPCPDNCPGRYASEDIADATRPAVNCPVNEAKGRWGWPCGRTMAQVIADEDGSRVNNLATLAR